MSYVHCNNGFIFFYPIILHFLITDNLIPRLRQANKPYRPEHGTIGMDYLPGSLICLKSCRVLLHLPAE